MPFVHHVHENVTIVNRNLKLLPSVPLFHSIEFSGINGSPCHVVVAEHHPLGVASCAGGEDEGAALVDGDLPQPGHQNLLLLDLSPAQQIGPTQHTRMGWHPTVLNHLFKEVE